ncbi:MAG: phosphodiester glycosidase family protein [bacterium]|nr:phosphodiester glycosidase family protein [bacterium]
MDKKKKKRGFWLLALCLALIPAFEVLFIVGCNSDNLIKFPFFVAIIVINILLILLLIYALIIYNKNKKASKRKLRTWLKVVLWIISIMYISGCVAFTILLYGPNEKFKTWLITTAMNTMNHQYLCKWFYSDNVIYDVLNKNYIKESGESTNPELIKKKLKEKIKENYNEYEKELLIHEEGELYKVVKFKVNGANAYIAAVFDPSKVKLEITQKIGVIGEYVTEMMRRNNAILGINAGGFVDQGNNLGESPTGITIVNKKIITDNTYGGVTSTGGIVGITDDNVLVLLKDKTAEEAIEMGVRDAVSWGPFLIVNGIASKVSGNGGYGGGARSAIGQRKDGTILLLVVDSNASRTNGAGMEDLVEIMQRYGAYNASNLDGGTSSVMDFRRDIAIKDFKADCHDYFSKYACHINDPIDSTGTHTTRYIADAWVVVE